MTGLKRISLLAVMSGCAVAWVADATAQTPSTGSGQGFPTKPMRMVVGFPPGGGPDVTARAVGQKMAESLGQSMVIENRPGASGYIAFERVAASVADGYTLLMMSSNDTALPALRSKLAYDIGRDLSPVSLVTVGPMMLVVRPTLAARNVKELIALAQSQPGKLKYGTSGAGGTVHLTSELFNAMAKAEIQHVPYKGSAESVVAVASGQIDMSFPSVTVAQPLVEAGRLRGLAVTGAKRMPSVPSLPTLDESGLRGFDRTAWYGVAAPAGVPKSTVALLNAEIGKVVNTADMKAFFLKQGLEVQTNAPEQFAAFIRSEIVQNARLAKLAGIKPE